MKNFRTQRKEQEEKKNFKNSGLPNSKFIEYQNNRAYPPGRRPNVMNIKNRVKVSPGRRQIV